MQNTDLGFGVQGSDVEELKNSISLRFPLISNSGAALRVPRFSGLGLPISIVP